jgi:hypothetical protein
LVQKVLKDQFPVRQIRLEPLLAEGQLDDFPWRISGEFRTEGKEKVLPAHEIAVNLHPGFGHLNPPADGGACIKFGRCGPEPFRGELPFGKLGFDAVADTFYQD